MAPRRRRWRIVQRAASPLERLEVFEASLEAKNVGAFQTARAAALEAEQQLDALLAAAPSAPEPVADAGPPVTSAPQDVNASRPASSG
jgi:hypothetical protein